MTRKKKPDWLARYWAWLKANSVPWTAYADFPEIAARTADFMEAGGAPDAEIFLVFSHLIARKVMAPIDVQDSEMARARRPCRLNGVKPLRVTTSWAELPDVVLDEESVYV
jgi:hypothetical protein